MESQAPLIKIMEIFILTLLDKAALCLVCSIRSHINVLRHSYFLTKSMLMVCWHCDKLMLLFRRSQNLKDNNYFSEKLLNNTEFCSEQRDKGLSLLKR